MRQTVLNILLGHNDVIVHNGHWYRVISTYLRPCPIYPKVIVLADTWPAESQRMAIPLDAEARTSVALGTEAMS